MLFLFAFFSTVVGAVTQAQFDALDAVYGSAYCAVPALCFTLVSPNATCPNNDVLNCNGAGLITHLAIDSAVGSISTWIGRLTGLTSLSLQFSGSNEPGDLTGTLPSELGLLTLLGAFVAHNQRLEGALPSTFARLSNLNYVHLAQNKLSGRPLDVFHSMTNMQVLFLGDNNFSGTLNATALARMSKLVEFGLTNTLVSGGLPSQIGLLAQLRLLFLGGSKFSSLPTQVGLLTSLREGQFHQNEFTGQIPTEIARLSDVTVLTLQRNRFTGAAPPINLRSGTCQLQTAALDESNCLSCPAQATCNCATRACSSTPTTLPVVPATPAPTPKPTPTLTPNPTPNPTPLSVRTLASTLPPTPSPTPQRTMVGLTPPPTPAPTSSRTPTTPPSVFTPPLTTTTTTTTKDDVSGTIESTTSTATATVEETLTLPPNASLSGTTTEAPTNATSVAATATASVETPATDWAVVGGAIGGACALLLIIGVVAAVLLRRARSRANDAKAVARQSLAPPGGNYAAINVDGAARLSEYESGNLNGAPAGNYNSIPRQTGSSVASEYELGRIGGGGGDRYNAAPQVSQVAPLSALAEGVSARH